MDACSITELRHAGGWDHKISLPDDMRHDTIGRFAGLRGPQCSPQGSIASR